MSTQCKTRRDADLRIAKLRLGSLVNPTEEYLITFRRRLYDFLDTVNDELFKVAKKNSEG
jgi:hypothetical protein